MQIGQNIGALLAQYLIQSPVYVVWIIGIVLCIVRWGRHPRASLFAVIGLSILLLQSLVFTAFTAWLPFSLRAGGIGVATIGTVNSVIQILRTGFSVVAYGLIVAAIFADRRGQGLRA